MVGLEYTRHGRPEVHQVLLVCGAQGTVGLRHTGHGLERAQFIDHLWFYNAGVSYIPVFNIAVQGFWLYCSSRGF